MYLNTISLVWISFFKRVQGKGNPGVVIHSVYEHMFLTLACEWVCILCTKNCSHQHVKT